MRQGTSGFWVEEKDGELRIGYEDYGVSEFGGSDYERTYTLDKENAKKFVAALKSKHKGTLKMMIRAEFGRNFDDSAFWDFCKRHEIKYDYFSWVS